MSFDGVCDSKANRKAIFIHRGLILHIPDTRGRKQIKRGGKRVFEPEIFRERFRTLERVFAWEPALRRVDDASWLWSGTVKAFSLRQLIATEPLAQPRLTPSAASTTSRC